MLYKRKSVHAGGRIFICLKILTSFVLRLCRFYAIIHLKVGDKMKSNQKRLDIMAVLFVVSLVVLTVLAVVVGVLEYYGDFASAWYFIRNDSILLRAVGSIYGKAFLFSIVSIVLFTVVRYVAKSAMLNQAKVYTAINLILGGVVSVFVVFISISQANTGEALDATKILYDSLNIAEPTVSSVITPFQIILAMHVGVFSAFVFWIAEKIVRHK